MPHKQSDWNPGAYARFRDLRLRPALDLLAQVPDLPSGDVVDLGCGNGAVGAALAGRFNGHSLVGVDNSRTMLAEAKKAGVYASLHHIDIADWQADTPPALVFSNAALHWLPDHARLLPALAGVLATGGVLAVQMPRQFDAPSHRLLRQTAQNLFPDRFNFDSYVAPVAPPVRLAEMLAGLGDLNIWETRYFQTLTTQSDAHPVRNFTASTAMRPVLAKLDLSEQTRLTAAYDQALHAAYPVHNGRTTFPFLRQFFTLTRNA